MDHDETTAEYTTTDFLKDAGKITALSAAQTAGGIAGLLVVAFGYGKIVEYREARKAKKALMQD